MPTRCLSSVICTLLLIPSTLLGAVPSWWLTRGVTSSSVPLGDFMPANVGQLKHLARSAADEMDATLPGGAGGDIHSLVGAWATQSQDHDDFAAINVGQLKAVATLFYVRLQASGKTISLPWDTSPSATDRDDFAIANIGQVKNVFAFEINCPAGEPCTPTNDTDGDLLVDAWELQHFGNITTQTAATDIDTDGLSNLEEMVAGTNPNSKDTDGDFMSDSYEVLYSATPDPLSALDRSDALEDQDRDGVPNVYEFAKNRNPNSASSLPSPDYIVDSVTGGNSSSDNIFSTVSEAVAAAPTTVGGQPAYSFIQINSGEYTSETGLDSITKRLFIHGVISNWEQPTLQMSEESFSPITIKAPHVVISNLQIEQSKWFTGSLSEFARVGLYVDLPINQDELRVVNCVFPCRQFDTVATNTRMPIDIGRGSVVLVHCTIYSLEPTSLIPAIRMTANAHVTLKNTLMWLSPSYKCFELAYSTGSDEPIDLSQPENAVLKAKHLSSQSSLITSNFGENRLINLFDRYGKLRSLAEYSSFFFPIHMHAGHSGPYASIDIDGESRIATTSLKPHVGADQYVDSDTDGLPDWWEQKTLSGLSHSANGDPDTDGVVNAYEYALGLNPTSGDSDANGESDRLQIAAMRSDQWYPLALRVDTDGDGLDDGTELWLNSNPNNVDSNGDGLNDGQAFALGLNPGMNDFDSDGLSNVQELALGTSPYDEDTDHDGYNDGIDEAPLDQFSWSKPISNPSDTTAPLITILQPADAVLVP